MGVPVSAAALVSAAMVSAAMMFAPSVSSAPVGCGSLGGAVEDGRCHVVDIQPAYQVDITFPLDYPEERVIVDYLSQTREGFLNVVQTPGSRTVPYEMDVTAAEFRSARTRSVVLTLFQDVGSAHPTTWYKSFTYDLKRNSPVTFDSLFAPGARPLDAVFPIVQRELETTTGLAGSISASDGLDPARYQNFAVTDDAVIFFFGRAELLPSYAGATSVSVPRNALPPLQI